MDKERIDRIRKLGDQLTQYVINNETKGKRFFNEFRNTTYPHFRNNLLRILSFEAKQGRLLFNLEDYIEIFEFAENAAHHDWALARDMVYIRLVEQLFQAKWSGFAQDDVVFSDEEDDETEAI